MTEDRAPFAEAVVSGTCDGRKARRLLCLRDGLKVDGTSETHG